VGTSFILAIGIDEYRSPRIHNLSWAAADALAIHRELTLGRAAGSVRSRLLVNDQATIAAIRESLGEWLGQARPDDSIIAFFAGHGARELHPGGDLRTDTESYLLPTDADIDHIYSTAFSLVHELPVITKRIRAGNVTFIFDCCLSGGARVFNDGVRARGIDGPNFTRTQRIADIPVNTAVTAVNGIDYDIGEGTTVMMACGYNQSASESDELGHGIFTYHLLNIVGSLRTPERTSVSLGEMYAGIVRAVVSYTNAAQVPMLEGRLVDQRLFIGL
jgi:uncharacterized caspase-like protein